MQLKHIYTYKIKALATEKNIYCMIRVVEKFVNQKNPVKSPELRKFKKVLKLEKTKMFYATLFSK